MLAQRLGGAGAGPAAAGVAAIVGHVYPVWLGFRGGKGVATACGVFTVLTPLAVPPALAIFLASRVGHQIHLCRIGAGFPRRCRRSRTSRAAPGPSSGRRWPRRLSSCFDTVSNLARVRDGTEWRLGARGVMRRVAVLGAGSWGTALAVHLGRIGHDVSLWARDASLAADIASHRVNGVYLPGVALPANVCGHACSRRGARRHRPGGFRHSDSHGCRAVMRARPRGSAPRATIVSATKGLESDTLLRMSEVIARGAGRRARRRRAVGSELRASRSRASCRPRCWPRRRTRPRPNSCRPSSASPYFRLYRSADVIGVEIGGATKNVIAIAAGVVEGLGLGHNALAALITRGLAEITRLACAAGGRRETTAGLSGLGDLVLTCTGTLSRNRHVGIELARGRKLADILAGMKMIAEGVKTTGAALALGERHGVELPIATQMAAVLEGRSDVRTAVEALMVRRQRAEREAV